ncbi:hypothetical protein DBR39_13790 [Chryseobacterium sp. KBW03]|uniref:hypothetical protein n=1 Tax=Chryseobacterium sp. KBW03 TaxID=2153362 RepID=UPI000F595A07|nr:hypothetical protein [Chryseobacterium sp. KBW03]RQO37954.1 hypothetical protein DBR39_13790 [Chryseobacterium sp. KBW03]
MPNDIILTEKLEPLIENGDFIIDESTYQHQNILLLADKGQFKASPLVGVGAQRYLEGSNINDFAREIRQEFQRDGMVVRSLQIGADLKIQVDAIYTT